MTQYEHRLVAVKRLLDAVGETQWAEWIATDIDRWREAEDTSHHLSAYGGMSSFNDIIFSQGNEHSLTAVTEPWANTLLLWLRSLCHFLAQHPDATFTAEALALYQATCFFKEVIRKFYPVS